MTPSTFRAGQAVRVRRYPTVVGTVSDPAYQHNGREMVLVEWPDDEWMGVLLAHELEALKDGPTEEDTLDGETSWPPNGEHERLYITEAPCPRCGVYVASDESCEACAADDADYRERAA